MYNHMSTLIEGLETETTDKFDEVKEKLFKELKKIEKDKLSIQEQGEKTQEIFDNLFSNWSEDDIQTFQTKYEKYFRENFEIGDDGNMEYLLNNATPEKIKFIDSLSQKHQDALEKIYNSMDQDKIDKLLNLENDKFNKVLSEIIEKQ